MPLIVSAVCLGVLGAAVQIAAHGQPFGWLTVASGVWLVARMVAFVTAAILMLRANRRAKPERFAITRRGFGVPYAAAHLSALALLILPLTAGLVADAVNLWRDGEWLMFWLPVGIGLFGLIVGASVVWAARGYPIELTPEGITQRMLPWRRTIPWDALEPGEPLHLSLVAKYLELTVARPELVAQRGYAPGCGTRARPRLPLIADVSPLLLADTIRWYIDNPADRANIGRTTATVG